MSTGLGTNYIPNLADEFQDQNPNLTALTLSHFETPAERFRICPVDEVRYYAALPIGAYTGTTGQGLAEFQIFGVVGINQVQADILRKSGVAAHTTTLSARPEADSKNRERYDAARYLRSPLWTRTKISEPAHAITINGIAANQSSCCSM